VLGVEVGAFARTLSDPPTRARYAQLEQAVAEGVVPPHLLGALEAMLELVLQTRRIRSRHGHEAHQALEGLYHRTSRGTALRRASHDVSRALRALSGQTIERLAISAGPGYHSLTIETDRCRAIVRLDAAGARVDSLEVGG
jgi:hypothetical protein